jgi:hypothetical protein
MKTAVCVAIACAALIGSALAQEKKPVPSDSARVFVPGCSKGSIFTAGRRTVDEPGSGDVPVGMHLRMNGPKKLMGEIKAHEGQMIEITGLVKKGQFKPDGVGLGGGVRVGPGPSPGSIGRESGVNQSFIDVEGWRPVDGSCPSR